MFPEITTLFGRVEVKLTFQGEYIHVDATSEEMPLIAFGKEVRFSAHVNAVTWQVSPHMYFRDTWNGRKWEHPTTAGVKKAKALINDDIIPFLKSRTKEIKEGKLYQLREQMDRNKDKIAGFETEIEKLCMSNSAMADEIARIEKL